MFGVEWLSDKKMLCRALLTAVAVSCTFSCETIASATKGTPCAIKEIFSCFCRRNTIPLTETADRVSDLICVLFLSGIQKEDLDVALLRKLETRNIQLDELHDEKVRQECVLKYYMENEGSRQNVTHNDLAIKDNITKTSFGEILEDPDIEQLLRRLKDKKSKTPPTTKTTQLVEDKNISSELKFLEYKVEAVTQNPVLAQKVSDFESDIGMPTLSNVISFWKKYLKSSSTTCTDKQTTKAVTSLAPEKIISEENERISKGLEDYMNKIRPYSEMKKILNKKILFVPLTEKHIAGNRISMENEVQNQDIIKITKRNQLNSSTPKDDFNSDLSFKNMLTKLASMLSKDTMEKTAASKKRDILEHINNMIKEKDNIENSEINYNFLNSLMNDFQVNRRQAINNQKTTEQSSTFRTSERTTAPSTPSVSKYVNANALIDIMKHVIKPKEGHDTIKNDLTDQIARTFNFDETKNEKTTTVGSQIKNKSIENEKYIPSKLNPQKDKKLSSKTDNPPLPENPQNFIIHPDIIRRIAEDVKQIVLKDIQNSFSTSTTEPMTSIVSRTVPTTREQTTTTTVTPTTLKPTMPASTTGIPSLPTTMHGSTTADVLAAMTKIDPENLKQATIIIEKFIELFKHINFMQDKKTTAMTATPQTVKPQCDLHLDNVKSQVMNPLSLGKSEPSETGQINSQVMNSLRSGKSEPSETRQINKPSLQDTRFQSLKQYPPMDIYNMQQQLRQSNLYNTNLQDKPMSPFETRMQLSKPPNPYEVKIQSARAIPYYVGPYGAAPYPFEFRRNPSRLPTIPLVSKLNNSITIHQTDAGAIIPIPIQMLNPISMNHILTPAAVTASVGNKDVNKWNLLFNYGSNTKLYENENHKQKLTSYTNTPKKLIDANIESLTQQKLLEFQLAKTMLSSPMSKNFINALGLNLLAGREAPNNLYRNLPAVKVEEIIPEDVKKENISSSNMKHLMSEFERIAKMFGHTIVSEVTEKPLNASKDIDADISSKLNKVADILESRYFRTTQVPKVTVQNKKKHDSRLDKIEKLARLLRMSDRQDLIDILKKDIQSDKQTSTRSISQIKDYSKEKRVNLRDSIRRALSNLKNNKEFRHDIRDKGISYDRSFKLPGTSFGSGSIPVGYHEMLEKLEEDLTDFDDSKTDRPLRQLTPISKIKHPKYNDANFNNFLRTQQKVNKILERILATRSDNGAETRSTETI